MSYPFVGNTLLVTAGAATGSWFSNVTANNNKSMRRLCLQKMDGTWYAGQPMSKKERVCCCATVLYSKAQSAANLV
jgi:hypothetical protein